MKRAFVWISHITVILLVGLGIEFAPAYHRQGYAAEAVRAMIGYAVSTLKLERIVATTTYDNLASTGVMRKVGMRIERNPYPDPSWFQVAGILENRDDFQS